MTINTSFQSLGGIKQLVKTIKMATDKACPHVTGLIYCSVSN